MTKLFVASKSTRKVQCPIGNNLATFTLCPLRKVKCRISVAQANNSLLETETPKIKPQQEHTDNYPDETENFSMAVNLNDDNKLEKNNMEMPNTQKTSLLTPFIPITMETL